MCYILVLSLLLVVVKDSPREESFTILLDEEIDERVPEVVLPPNVVRYSMMYACINSVYIIYIYIYIYIPIPMYVCIYIYRERERLIDRYRDIDIDIYTYMYIDIYTEREIDR